jgi:hypothetical protein
MNIDRRHFFTSVGGVATVALMDSEAKADALEDYMIEQLREQSEAQQQGRSADRHAALPARRGQLVRGHAARGEGQPFGSHVGGSDVPGIF